jgi:hypothetical protein
MEKREEAMTEQSLSEQEDKIAGEAQSPAQQLPQQDSQETLPRDDRIWRSAFPSRPTVPPEHLAHLSRARGTSRRRQPPKTGPTRQALLWPWGIRDYALVAVLMAIVSGVSGTVVYDRMNNGAVVMAVRNRIVALPAEKPILVAAKPAPAPAPTPLPSPPPTSKKPVATAQLRVADVSGEANVPIPLSLTASPATPGQPLALRLTGLPDSAYLTAGKKTGINGWLLKPGEAKSVKLVVPKAPAPEFAVDVVAVEPDSGEMVSPIVEMNVALKRVQEVVIMPAAVPMGPVTNYNAGPARKPENARLPMASNYTASEIPQAVEMTQTSPSELKKLMNYGNGLLESGDLIAARTFYAKALSLGEKQAALQLGKTYDPSVFIEKKVQGLQPDAAMALHYYKQAADSGIAEAQSLLAELQMKLAR